MNNHSKLPVFLIILCILAIFYFLFPYFLFPVKQAQAPAGAALTAPQPPITDPLPALTVRVMDVGHGDCILIRSGGQTMVIDTGEPAARDKLTAVLREERISRIDILLLTHPHSDHIGNAEFLLRHYQVGTVYMTAREHTTKQYRSLLSTLEEMPYVGVEEAFAGKAVDLGGASCVFLGPLSLDYEDMNDASAVLMLLYGNKRFLFMADAEQIAEEDYLKSYGSALHADFLKVGHHANNSTTMAFASAVSPTVSVVSMKSLSEYGTHEREYKESVFRQLERLGSRVCRTDRDGDIIVVTDGLTLNVTVTRE